MIWPVIIAFHSNKARLRNDPAWLVLRRYVTWRATNWWRKGFAIYEQGDSQSLLKIRSPNQPELNSYKDFAHATG